MSYYDYTAGTWTLADSLNVRRKYGHSVTILNDGRVLVAGGSDLRGDPLQSIYMKNCELYDPVIDKWTITDSLLYQRTGHTSTLLLDGRALVCGGINKTDKELNSCEIFDPETEAWTVVDSMNQKRTYHSATLLTDGRVLVAGGINSDSVAIPWINTCEIYDPVSDIWSNAGMMHSARVSHYGILLNNELILLAGGEAFSNVWEIYNPVSMQTERWDYYPVDKLLPTMHLLHDAKVISIGGMSWEDITFFYTEMCEIYDPDYTSVIGHIDNKPTSFKLYQNYPNPFNPSTVIKYYLPNKSFVKLNVYDLSGKLVSVLVNKIQSAGFYSFNFNAQNLSSGLYICRLNTNKISKIMKMLKVN